jgi:hypothetical protein
MGEEGVPSVPEALVNLPLFAGENEVDFKTLAVVF